MPQTRTCSRSTRSRVRSATTRRARDYVPLPLAPREDEMRRSGGIVTMGRREVAQAARVTPAIAFPDAATARTLTSTQQVLWAHRVDKDADVRPGATIRVYADLLPASDGTAPFAIHTFNQITGGDVIHPRQAAIANDHFVFTGEAADAAQVALGKAFADRHRMAAPRYATPGDGIFHFYFPEQGLVRPGDFIPGADSHSRAYGAYGAVGIGVGSTTLGFGWSTGYIYITVARQRRVRFTGRLQPWVAGKDIVLELLRRWGAAQAQGMSVELVDEAQQLPIPYRNTIANMMAEAEAMNGIFAPDAITSAWFDAKGMAERPYPPFAPGEAAEYAIDEAVDLSDVRPMIAKPFSPGNAFAADEVARERLTFDTAMIGSCTNGGYADLLQAALVLQAATGASGTRAAVPFLVFPGSGGVAAPDRASRCTARRPIDRRRAARHGRRDPSVAGVARASGRGPTPSPRGSAPSRRSIATGRTAWAWAAKATSRAPRSSPHRRCWGSWRLQTRWVCRGTRNGSASEGRPVRPSPLSGGGGAGLRPRGWDGAPAPPRETTSRRWWRAASG